MSYTYTAPVINTQAIMDRQAATLQTNLTNIVQPVSTGGTFWDKLNNILTTAAPIVSQTQNIVTSLQNRVPGTSIPYSQQYQQQQYQQARPQSNMQPVLIGGALLLAGFLIYKAVK